MSKPSTGKLSVVFSVFDNGRADKWLRAVSAEVGEVAELHAVCEGLHLAGKVSSGEATLDDVETAVSDRGERLTKCDLLVCDLREGDLVDRLADLGTSLGGPQVAVQMPTNGAHVPLMVSRQDVRRFSTDEGLFGYILGFVDGHFNG